MATGLLASAVTLAVVTENSVRSENTGVPIIREIMVATTISSLFVAIFALLTSTLRTRAALQAEILALRHQLAVFQKTRRVACASTDATSSVFWQKANADSHFVARPACLF